ncbi:hypothetical protein AB3S75_013417 [Citrus x aurantiifolia]
MEIKLLFLSTLVLLVCCIARNNFDHFLLVQTWPHGYCERIQRNCSIRNYFVIHGLWPVTAKGKAFLSGKRKRVNVSDTIGRGNLFKDMQYYWPGLTKKDLNLWKDQWFAHGSDSPLVPLDYFQRTIQLRKLVDLVKALRDVGIVPRYKGFTHHKSTYRQGIMKITGHNNTILKCYSSKRGHLLSEVMLCVDADARNFIDCNPEEFQQQNCGPDILF